LVREPHNPYDANAIRIDNMHHQKVGHVKREQAMTLAPLMDHHQPHHLVLDGTIPYPGNDYTMPLQVDLYWKATAAPELLHVDDVTAITQMMELLQRRPLVYFQAHSTMAGMVNRSTSSSSSRLIAPPPPPPMIVQKKALDWTTQQQELDDMFDQQLREQLSCLPEIPMPSQLVNVDMLFEYQVLGIRWMVHQETRTHHVPVFFQERPPSRHQPQRTWFCTITNCAQSQPPQPIRGSILADGMCALIACWMD
jgi:SWI/SNF-related matrix-associated actin-dependent regulator of chromatin subfamily A3